MSFEPSRAHLCHTILANGFFSYLSEPPSFWKNRARSIEVRSVELSHRWKEIASRDRSIKQAYSAWCGQTDERKCSISDSVLSLYELAIHHPRVKPTKEFPSLPVVSAWLSQMSALMNLLAAAEFAYESDQIPAVHTFWMASLTLYEFLQDLRFGGERFWFYFEKK